MKTYKNLKLTIEDRIAVITLNRPSALNALNQDMMGELWQFFTHDIEDLDISGIVLTGEGEKAFVAGADISEFLEAATNQRELSEKGHETFFAIERCKKPVIAAVNGFALGGGCELAMACHLRVAGANAKFGTPEVNLGIIPGFGGTQRLVQLIGKGKALELMMTADMVGAEDALRLGLVNHVVGVGEEVAKAKEILLKIAKKAPIAISKVIEGVNACFDKTKNGYEVEIESFGELSKTEDFKEGASAFLEKRKAVFQGK